jgi:hypothetical protein
LACARDFEIAEHGDLAYTGNRWIGRRAAAFRTEGPFGGVGLKPRVIA